MNVSISLLIAIGGAIGSLTRYWVGIAAASISGEMPWGTIGINILGSFIIGLFGTLTLAGGQYPASEPVRLFVMVGFCGGFTTFSAFSLQTLDLLRGGHPARAGINVLVSVAACLVAVWIGHALGARLNGGAVQIAQIAAEEEA